MTIESLLREISGSTATDRRGLARDTGIQKDTLNQLIQSPEVFGPKRIKKLIAGLLDFFKGKNKENEIEALRKLLVAERPSTAHQTAAKKTVKEDYREATAVCIRQYCQIFSETIQQLEDQLNSSHLRGKLARISIPDPHLPRWVYVETIKAMRDFLKRKDPELTAPIFANLTKASILIPRNL